MNILIVAFEEGRWGPARLPRALVQAGFRVAGLCPADNALAKTRFLERHFELADVASSRNFERRLAEAMQAFSPTLVVLADERVVACLHAVIRQARASGAGPLTKTMLDVLGNSLGAPERFDQMLLKHETLALARRLGVQTPAGETASSAAEAAAAASRLGFPVYVKTSFSWAGRGVIRCENEAEVEAAFAAATPKRKFAALRGLMKRLVHRDWYPEASGVEVQKAIVGKPAMYCLVALEGRILEGFTGVARRNVYEGGPSSVVWIGPDPEIEAASATMVTALGASGFLGFDFMIEEATGRAYLLESNPRPIQVCHLGAVIGADLCAALASALRDEPRLAADAAKTEAVVALFPQERMRDPDGASAGKARSDEPQDDPGLLAFMMAAAQAKAAA